MGFIYCITNTETGKKYIGQTTQNINKRFSSHCYAAKQNKDTIGCRRLVNSMKHYGVEYFKIETLIEVDNKLLDENEIKFIKMYNTIHPEGYNLVGGGQGFGNRIISDETREKLSNIRLGVAHTEESKKKMSNSCKGRIMSKEVKQKISQSIIKTKSNPEYCISDKAKQSIINTNKNRIFTSETRDKMSKRKKDVPLSEEHKHKISKAHIGKKQTKEHNESISRALTGRKCSEQHIENNRTAQLGKKLDNEHKKKIAINTKIALAKKTVKNFTDKLRQESCDEKKMHHYTKKIEIGKEKLILLLGKDDGNKAINDIINF